MIRLLGVAGVLVGAGVSVWVLVFVVSPWLQRRHRRRELADRRRAELEGVLHEQQVTAAGQAWEDMQRHRERLERGLDEFHSGRDRQGQGNDRP